MEVIVVIVLSACFSRTSPISFINVTFGIVNVIVSVEIVAIAIKVIILDNDFVVSSSSVVVIVVHRYVQFHPTVAVIHMVSPPSSTCCRCFVIVAIINIVDSSASSLLRHRLSSTLPLPLSKISCSAVRVKATVCDVMMDD